MRRRGKSMPLVHEKGKGVCGWSLDRQDRGQSPFTFSGRVMITPIYSLFSRSERPTKLRFCKHDRRGFLPILANFHCRKRRRTGCFLRFIPLLAATHTGCDRGGGLTELYSVGNCCWCFNPHVGVEFSLDFGGQSMTV